MIGQDSRYKKITGLLHQTHKIRNVSIVAHVDHGKTTLADCLISSNGIIHKKQAGQLKILDDRLDQQDRGITMKASSISLLCQDHLINLIDSPGHLEFYSEVSSALRLTDSALLVVDTVEGVSSQTYRVLQQLYIQKLPAILVLNKIDKLITHCKMDPLQAYHHLNQIIEQVNAVLGSFIIKEVGQKKTERSKSEDMEDQKIDKLEALFYFCLEKKNIIFAAAFDNWGFAVQSFAPLIANKIGKNSDSIQKYLWGDYYFNPKTKEFQDEPRNQNDRPVCVDWILKPIWDIFENVQSENKQKIQKIITTLQLKIGENTKKNYNSQLIKQILNAWLPLDKIVLERIVEVLPNPIEAQKFRLPYLLELNNRDEPLSQEIKLALEKCSHSEGTPLIAFVAKMVNIPKNNFNQRGLNQLKADGETKTLAFARIFSGTIKRGAKVVLIGAKKKKIEDEKGQISEVADITQTCIQNLYFFNAQYPQGVTQAYAGNIVGIGNLQNYIFKSGTVSTSEECISFVPISSQTKSILKVSVSTPNIQNNHKLLDGLKKLNKSDPSVDVYIEKNGDIILNTCGEVHLEKCIVDLEKIYCKIPITTSQPIITFRETIIWQTLKENKNQKYIFEQLKKKKIIEKKLLMEKYKEEMKVDAELDEQQKQKLKAIQEWDFHVEKYQSEDLTVEDTRFFFKNREDQEEEKYSYKKQKQIKKIDHKNRGKMHNKKQFLNLNLKTNQTVINTPNLKLKIKVKALGLPFQIAEFLDKNVDRMKKLFNFNKKQMDKEIEDHIRNIRKDFLKEFLQKMKQFEVQEQLSVLIQQKMICFGAHTFAGTNLLICKNISKASSLFETILNSEEGRVEDNKFELQLDKKVLDVLEEYKTTPIELLTSIRMGFSLACSAGPLCNEQMMGVIFIIEEITAIQAEPIKEEKQEKPKNQDKHDDKKENSFKEQEIIQETITSNQISQAKLEENSISKIQKLEENKGTFDNFGPLAGQIMSAVKLGCLEAFLGGSPRLVEPMYLCELHTDQQYYGSIYNQLSKRRASIISEDLHEFSNFFIIKAYLPMLESKNLCFDILDKTQGTVNAQLNLDTWKVFEEDPFYTPLTEEEIQEEGLENVIPNPARILLERIRQKKGLAGTEKIVVAAEKQRTLKKN